MQAGAKGDKSGKKQRGDAPLRSRGPLLVLTGRRAQLAAVKAGQKSQAAQKRGLGMDKNMSHRGAKRGGKLRLPRDREQSYRSIKDGLRNVGVTTQ